MAGVMPIFQAKTQNASGPTTNELSSRISCICSQVSTSCDGWLPARRCSWSCARPPLLSSVPVVWLVVLRGVLRTSVPGGDDWQLIRLYLTVHCIDVARLGSRRHTCRKDGATARALPRVFGAHAACLMEPRSEAVAVNSRTGSRLHG